MKENDENGKWYNLKMYDGAGELKAENKCSYNSYGKMSEYKIKRTAGDSSVSTFDYDNEMNVVQEKIVTRKADGREIRHEKRYANFYDSKSYEDAIKATSL